MKTNFKVGDKVYDSVRFPGTTGIVTYIDDNTAPVSVSVAGKDTIQKYYSDGRYFEDIEPTLSKVPYTFQLPEQPVEFEKGDPVLVRDKDTSVWVAARFIEYANEGNCRYMVIVDAFATAWNYCIPFDLEKMGRV